MEAVYQYLVAILSPITDNLLFLNQRKSKNTPRKNVPVTHGSTSGQLAYEADTRRPCKYARFSSLCNMKVNEELKWIVIFSFHRYVQKL